MDGKPSILRFVLRVEGNPMEIMRRFHPDGKAFLNRSVWRGKEPRSCSVSKVSGRSHSWDSKEPLIFDVEVAYRPKGTITYVGNTRYDGWTALLPKRAADGTLLDAQGNPLADGEPSVYLPYELYEDIDFDSIDFGDFVEEVEVDGVKRITHDELMARMQGARSFGASIKGVFMVPRRQRQRAKVILAKEPSGIAVDHWGSRLQVVNEFTPQLKRVVSEHMAELMAGFLEGRIALKTLSADDFVFVELSDAFVDCTANTAGGPSRFDCLLEFVPDNFYEDLARQLMSTYEIDVTVVTGPNGGLVLKRSSADNNPD